MRRQKLRVEPTVSATHDSAAPILDLPLARLLAALGANFSTLSEIDFETVITTSLRDLSRLMTCRRVELR